MTYLDEGGVLKRRVAVLGPALADQDELGWEQPKVAAEIGITALTVMLIVMLMFVGGVGYLVQSIVREDLRAGKHVPEEERVLTVIREYYREHEYRPGVVRDIAPNGSVQTANTMLSVLVEFRDYSRRRIAVEKVGERYLVDWESWVGHSELPWTEFLKSRPKEEKMFRVRCSPVEYYNFDFGDDGKWQSFRLESPDQKLLIFGYAERHSAIARALIPRSDGPSESSAILLLRFPENPRSRNQVIISKFLGSGWVLEGERN